MPPKLLLLVFLALARGYAEELKELDKLTEVIKLSRFNIDEFGALDELNTAVGLARRVEDGLARNGKGISEGCRKNLWDYVKGLVGKKKKFWAYQMFDSSSRLPSGLGTGHLVDLGFFDECLAIEATLPKETILGKHCIGTLTLDDLLNITQVVSSNLNVDLFQPDPRVATPRGERGFQFSLCLPSSCSAEDLNRLFFHTFRFYDFLCQTKDDGPELDGLAIATLCFLGIVLAIIAAATTYDVVLHLTGKDALHSLLIAFSVLTNGKKLVKVSKTPNQVSCLHGIRVISTMWVIIGHRYFIQALFPLRNYLGALEWLNSKSSMFLLNAPLSVDTFFLMSGLVVTYIYLLVMKSGIKFNVFLFYFHRYLRLTPVLAVIILIHATLFKYFGTGPLFPTAVNQLAPACGKYWWKSLLYIQNYGLEHPADICVPQTWYLSVDTQLFVLAPLLLVPIRRWPFHTVLVAGFLTVCSMVSCFVTGWVLELNSYPNGNLGGTIMDYLRWYYAATYTRAAPWLIGIVLGYYIFEIKQGTFRVKMRKSFILVMWFLALLILCTCAFTGFNMMNNYSRLVHSLHMTLVRPAWAIALSWIILACVLGHGGPVNWFLSLPIFQVVSRLTYTLYLVHYQVIAITTSQMRAPATFGNGEMMYAFWGDFAASFAVALVFTLAFESPIITIGKLLLDEAEKKLAVANGHKPTAPA